MATYTTVSSAHSRLKRVMATKAYALKAFVAVGAMGFVALIVGKPRADEDGSPVVIGESSDGPSPVTAFRGEWTGIVPELGMLVVVRARNDGGTTLAIATQEAESIVTHVYTDPRVELNNGRFVIQAGGFIIEGTAQETLRHGSGEARLMMKNDRRSGPARVYFFSIGMESWLRRMAELQALIDACRQDVRRDAPDAEARSPRCK
jgi:hypothetical protein